MSGATSVAAGSFVAAQGSFLKRTLVFVRFSHTVFALPFALGSAITAANGLPSWRVLGLVILCMVFARTAAMLFNRLADWEIDKRNPRTASRHTLLSRNAALGLLAVSSAGFITSAALLNPLCFALSPLALSIVFFYSLTKRFTRWSHAFLGLALAVAPVGAWLAVTGQFAWPPLALAMAVLFWVAGFDIVYATQDADFDRREGLHSLPATMGVHPSLALARAAHVCALIFLSAFGFTAAIGSAYWVAIAAIGIVIALEHSLVSRLKSPVRPSDAALINAAFFKSNAAVSVAFLAGVALGLL